MRTAIVTELEQLLTEHAVEVSRWFAKQFAHTAPPFYSSVDIRHSGYKIVPVDTNLFPAGFNNLSAAARKRAIISFKRVLQRDFANLRKVLLLAENHTRNKGYLENLAVLEDMLRQAGAEVRIGRSEGSEVISLTTISEQSITEYPLIKIDGKLQTTDGFIPELVIINNDMSAGIPPVIEDIEQIMVPAPNVGWHNRRKSLHFAAYSQVATEFAQEFGFDCWKIWTSFRQRDNLDFKSRQGMDELAVTVEEVLSEITAKYAQYGIKEEPYLFIKADAGTYGMGIMTVRTPAEIADMNKKLRNKMQIIKEGATNSRVLIQEGVATVDLVKGAPAEPMIYVIDGQPVGGAFRVNPKRDKYQNLNANGMYFTGMCDQDEQGATSHVPVTLCNYQVYSLVAKLASLAAARE